MFCTSQPCMAYLAYYLEGLFLSCKFLAMSVWYFTGRMCHMAIVLLMAFCSPF